MFFHNDNHLNNWYILVITQKEMYIMKKLLLSLSLLSALVLAACGSDTEDGKDTNTNANTENEEVEVKNDNNEEIETNKEKEEEEKVTNEVDVSIITDTSKPFNERLTELSTQLFGDETTTGEPRNITVDSMGDVYFVKLMIDDAITMNVTLDRAQRQTIELLRYVQQADDFEAINVNWQAKFDSGEIGSVVTVMFNKDDLKNVDLEKLRPEELEKVATNYGTHDAFKK